jgi:hypothetical protein
MSHRLQHLQRRRVESDDPTAAQTEGSEAINRTAVLSSNIKPSASANTANNRPVFASTNSFHPYTKQDYRKGQKAFPPPESLYIARDTEVDPCFLRATTMALHVQPRKNSLPFAVWISPFASDRVNVAAVSAPLRCSGCKAYVNPYFQFDGTRRSAKCNLCGLRFPID